ncbi:hypothetical protein [Cellulomonas wangsupingiae]|uniref:hypothetical protein n=1 Tax=Cellulomonas wangsupingiae TaxID=2968085 RepID=UPI001D0E046B|nr:hypothetical protein [Cellulomonas wangsupingiae]MCM0639999.1 hypothetical protein [Cellulomonas wangsupingiae]
MPGNGARGTWLRLVLLVVLGTLLLVAPAPDRTAALLTHTVDVTGTLWTPAQPPAPVGTTAPAAE